MANQVIKSQTASTAKTEYEAPRLVQVGHLRDVLGKTGMFLDRPGTSFPTRPDQL